MVPRVGRGRDGSATERIEGRHCRKGGRWDGKETGHAGDVGGGQVASPLSNGRVNAPEAGQRYT